GERVCPAPRFRDDRPGGGRVGSELLALLVRASLSPSLGWPGRTGHRPLAGASLAGREARQHRHLFLAARLAHGRSGPRLPALVFGRGLAGGPAALANDAVLMGWARCRGPPRWEEPEEVAPWAAHVGRGSTV